jgi:threonine/homoserine/homoserine lactone efflux protein
MASIAFHTADSFIWKEKAMEHLWLFALLVLGIVALPGMDMAFVMGSTLADGKGAGMAALCGVIVGGMAHVVMSSLGLGLILKHAPAAFNAMLIAGSLYVAWMGWSLLRSTGALLHVQDAPTRTVWRSFGGAMATNLLNPKAYIFMIAVFPQFYRPEMGSLLKQALMLGGIIALIQFLVYGAVAWAAVGLRHWLAGSASSQQKLARAVGIVLILTALWTLWTSWRQLA